MSDKQKEFDYNNMPALDDDSDENLKKVDDMMEFFYQQVKKETRQIINTTSQ